MNLTGNILMQQDAQESSSFYRMLKTWAEIDLSALRHNLSYLKKKLEKGTQVMAVVKCNAYGHGVIEVTKELLRQGIEALGVSSRSQ